MSDRLVFDYTANRIVLENAEAYRASTEGRALAKVVVEWINADLPPDADSE